MSHVYLTPNSGEAGSKKERRKNRRASSRSKFKHQAPSTRPLRQAVVPNRRVQIGRQPWQADLHFAFRPCSQWYPNEGSNLAQWTKRVDPHPGPFSLIRRYLRDKPRPATAETCRRPVIIR